MKSTSAEAGREVVETCAQAPRLREMVREASAALARLDADRLEELARCCQALNKDLRGAKGRPRLQPELAVQARESAGDFIVFTRVLEATRANLEVMKRLRAAGNRLGEGELEYGRNSGGIRWARPHAQPDAQADSALANSQHQEANGGND